MKVHVSDLTVDPEIQLASRGTDPNTVQDYVIAMTNGDEFPAIVAFRENGTILLSAGFHRVAAAQFLGLAEIEAEIREGSRQDAMVYAAIDNAKNARPMSQAQKREAGARLLRLTDWSQERIAKELAVGIGTISRWASSLPNGRDKPVTVTRNGTTYTMDISNIGKAQPEERELPTPPAIELAEKMVAQGECPSKEEWAMEPETYTGHCHKGCYAPRVLTKGSVYEYGVYGVYVCSGCGYAYPPFCAPAAMSDAELAQYNRGLSEFDKDEEEREPEPDPMAVHYSSKTAEHYTPQVIIDATLACLGEIDLDPCSNSQLSPNIPAARHFTADNDGLMMPWGGRVYMNPPYGREIDDWVAKLCLEYERGDVTEAIALVPARTDTQWWLRLRDYPVCFIIGRLTFGGNTDPAPFPSAVFYLGNDIGAFYHAFCELGDCWQRMEPGVSFGE